MKSNRKTIWHIFLLVLLPIQLFLNGFLFFMGNQSHPPADYADHSELLSSQKTGMLNSCSLPNRMLHYRTSSFKLQFAQAQNRLKFSGLLNLKENPSIHSPYNQFFQSLSNPLLQISHPPFYSNEIDSDPFSIA